MWEMNQRLTGYASVDRPWLQYYDKKDIAAEIPCESVISYAFEMNRERLDSTAIDSLEGEIHLSGNLSIYSKDSRCIAVI